MRAARRLPGSDKRLTYLTGSARAAGRSAGRLQLGAELLDILDQAAVNALVVRRQVQAADTPVGVAVVDAAGPDPRRAEPGGAQPPPGGG